MTECLGPETRISYCVFHVSMYDYLLTHAYGMKTKHFQRDEKRPNSTHLLKNLFT